MIKEDEIVSKVKHIQSALNFVALIICLNIWGVQLSMGWISRTKKISVSLLSSVAQKNLHHKTLYLLKKIISNCLF